MRRKSPIETTAGWVERRVRVNLSPDDQRFLAEVALRRDITFQEVLQDAFYEGLCVLEIEEKKG